MKITKLGHCCLVIKIDGKTILTDPGAYSTLQNEVKGIDLILITHEHQDHFHLESLQQVLKNNPDAKIITNSSVGRLLNKEGIQFEILEDKQQTDFAGIKLEGCGNEHAEIYKDWNRVQNTGYFIADKLFYPGDDFYNPQRPVDVLALPVGGPWMKISEAVKYALEVKPRLAFPVHDGGLKQFGTAHRVPSIILPKNGIEFLVLEIGKEYEI